MNFEEVYENFLDYASRRHKKQCFETITQNFKKHVLPYFKNINIQDLTINDVISWQDNIYDKEFSNNYNKNIYCSFNLFLNYCVLNSYISSNFLNIVGPFKKRFETKKHDVYNYYEFKLFRKGLKDKVYKYFFDLLFFYGLRSGEAMALKFSDLEGNKLHVGSSIHRRGNREIDSPKTKNYDRILHLDLNTQFKLFILKCYYIKKYGSDSLDYFIFGGNTPLSPTSIIRHKHNSCLNRNVKEITTHEFRHSYATRMLKKNVPIEVISKNLGHSSISITLDIYVHNEKRDIKSPLSNFSFFKTITQNFKKVLQSIITLFV